MFIQKGEKVQTQTKALVISAIVLILLIFSDVVSTDFGLQIPGLEEANPWSRRVLENWGVVGLYISFIFLSFLALTYPGMYLMLSRLADCFAEKTNSSKKSSGYTKWLLFMILFTALTVLIFQRLLVVTNNILLIISHS